jgi:hypothetical protein
VSKKILVKDVDDETTFWCAGGIGISREEVWVDSKGEVIRYNFALILPHKLARDNGRVLGFDNAHGVHERHFMGEVSEVRFEGFIETSKRFYAEAHAVRRAYEDNDYV